MGTRTQSHRLSNGLIVSGRPEPDNHLKPPSSTIPFRSIPYTGGDIKKSGELGKMFDIPGSTRSGSNSGHLSRLSNSTSMPRKSSTSGPLPLQPTGLITSGPLTSSGGPMGQPGGSKPGYGSGVTSLGSEGVRFGLRVWRVVMWVFGILVLMGLLVGVLIIMGVKKFVILVVVGVVLVPVLVGFVWNYGWGMRAILAFAKKFPDTELRAALDGQFVKVTGVVTCGSMPLESSFQRVPRCVYVSTELYEYKGWGGKSANAKHRCFSWGCRHSEKYVADFYISDFHSGLRALVKTGYGAKVAPLVEPATVVNITKEQKDLSPNFLQWLADRSLSSNDCIMRLKEGYVKEGSIVSVMGIVRRHENALMIVQPAEPVSTGCQRPWCLFPMYIDGLILQCDDNQNSEVIPV